MLLVLTAGCTAGEEPGMGSTERTEPSSPSATASESETATGSPDATAQPTAPPGRLAADLRQATWDDDLGAARRLVEQGADVNAKDDTQQSAYLIAASEGRDRILELTLRNGARVNDKDSFNGTALIRAAERGHAWATGRLLQAGIDRDHVNNLGWQAVHEAVWLGEPTQEYVDTVRVLVAGGVQLDRTALGQGLTPLEMARSKGHDGQVATLERARAEAPADPDALLLRAAAEGDPDSVAMALRHGADLETRDERRRTPLLLAVTEDRVAVARLLVAMGADPDAVDDQQDTPWLVTGVTGSVPMLEALLPADPDLTITNRYGGVSVIPASERGHVEYVRRVVQTPIDVDHVNDLGWTALLEAVVLGDGGPAHQEIVRILLDAGADPSIEDNDGNTALENARRLGHDEIARILEQAR